MRPGASYPGEPRAGGVRPAVDGGAGWEGRESERERERSEREARTSEREGRGRQTLWAEGRGEGTAEAQCVT